MRVLLCVPPGKVSNEIDTLRAMPHTEVLVVDADDVSRPADYRLPARRLPYLGAPERWTAGLAWLRGLSRLDLPAIDIVVSMELLNVGSIQANRLARRLGARHLVTVFEVLAKNPVYMVPPWRQISDRVAGSADGFICFSDLARDHAVERGCASEKCSVIYPGVNLDLFSPPVGGRTKEPVALFVGELRPDKGVRDLIKAADVVAERVPGFRLVIVGDGPLEAEVREATLTRPFLDFRGRLPRAHLPDIFRSAAVLVLTSHQRARWAEQFGFVLVEAMASGLPIVATTCGAIPEVVPFWNGLVPERDVVAIADEIVVALGSAGDEWGARNRPFACERFELIRQARRVELYMEARLDASQPLTPDGPAT
jgi:glycosyltransferase involved in cell wall biosynthesis